MLRVTSLVATAVLALGLSGACAARAPLDPQGPAGQIHQRTGTAARMAVPATPEIPVGIRLDDGLTPDEAVAVALWNNAAFQVSVSELGFARADLLEAGVLTNPVLSLLFPAGPKQLEATLRWPVELLWERPKRVAAARLAADAAAHRLVQAGLDLVLAVRIAYTDLGLALDRQQLAVEMAALLSRIDTLTQSRLTAGDISALDARAARVDLGSGQLDGERAAYDVLITGARLRLLLGLTAEASAFELTTSASPAADCPAPGDLLREALIARPDVRAAELGVESAAARLGWEHSRILTFTAALDANGEGREGFEAGPGADVSLPIFDRNQGRRARAHAELDRASAAYRAIQQQVALDLREATAQLDQARSSLAGWRDRNVVPLQATVTDAERAFAEGETSYLFVLEHRRRLADGRVRQRELAADEQRARARIERAVGRSCSAPPREASRDR